MLKERIRNDLSRALKEGNQTMLSTLRLLLSAILNKEIDKKFKEKAEGQPELTDEEIISVIASEVKKRKEAVLEFGNAGRKDLADKEKAEAEILQAYLPQQLSIEEVRAIIQEAIIKTGASSVKEMGKVMAELAPKIKGRADGSEVSRIVKELLSS
ncbi:MAG: GatB/YqeY domain-containing protein [bacterium]|nr:GatB/YqeY domain-containing protein [bacterium]